MKMIKSRLAKKKSNLDELQQIFKEKKWKETMVKKMN